MSLRCLALDSEKTALAELSYLLDQDSRVGQVIPISNAEQASAALKQEKVDAVFVCLVHHTVEEVNQLLAPYAEHTKFVALSRTPADAIKAFEFGAIDYILKPITPVNIQRSMMRLQEHFAPSKNYQSIRIKVEDNGNSYFVQSSEIFFIQALGDFSIATTARGDFLSKLSLSKLETNLAEAGFERVHRQWLVNLGHVDAIMNDCSTFSLQVGGRQIPVSRRCAKNVRQKLS
jgi:DNA-binding LytR/AlgR family response regulator